MIFSKPQYSTLHGAKKKDRIPPGTFDKCESCGDVLYANDFENNQSVCPHCNYHRPIPVQKRIELLTDPGSFKEIDVGMRSVDFLKSEWVAPYEEKLERDRKKTGLNEAVVTGTATLDQRRYALGVMDFRFRGASMGSVVGEKITRLIELATAERLPLVIVTTSGGARMEEGLFSLMQMAKTSGALQRHAEVRLPYIVIMTHPTTAGVTASFASLGDITLAEPKALIGFAGRRVIKDTTQATLPEGFQTSEFLLKKGMIDRIVHRNDLRRELSLFLEYLSGACLFANNKNSIQP